jgi:hypothetical protein
MAVRLDTHGSIAEIASYLDQTNLTLHFCFSSDNFEGLKHSCKVDLNCFLTHRKVFVNGDSSCVRFIRANLWKM